MKRKEREKLLVLATSFALFVGGVAALSMEHGTGRTLLLGGVLAALAAIAARQTIKNRNRRSE